MKIVNPELNLRKLRDLKGFTQENIATEMKISTKAYQKIETGETQLTINRLNEISEILGVSPMEVIGFDEKQLFKDCTQKGNIGINYNSQDFDYAKELLNAKDETIINLKNEIEFLRNKLK